MLFCVHFGEWRNDASGNLVKKAHEKRQIIGTSDRDPEQLLTFINRRPLKGKFLVFRCVGFFTRTVRSDFSIKSEKPGMSCGEVPPSTRCMPSLWFQCLASCVCDVVWENSGSHKITGWSEGFSMGSQVLLLISIKFLFYVVIWKKKWGYPKWTKQIARVSLYNYMSIFHLYLKRIVCQWAPSTWRFFGLSIPNADSTWYCICS